MKTSLLSAVHDDHRRERVLLELTLEGVRLTVNQKEYFSPFVTYSNGERNAYATLAACALAAAADGIELIGCPSCARFRISGMSQQFSGGEAGYCALAGFRGNQAVVSINHGCGEHLKVEGWHVDLEAAYSFRMKLAKREPRPSRRNAFEGAIVGLAVADALGYTQLSLAVAEALIAWNRPNLDTLLQGIASRFLDWSRSPDNDRSHSKGGGSAVRVAPIGLFFWRDMRRLLEVARASSRITHGHDAAVESSAAAALLVGLAMSKKNPEEMFRALMEECAPSSPDLKACLDRLPRLLDADPGEALSARGLGEGWVAEEAVVSALYCFWRAPLDFRASVLLAVNTDGDSDSIACILGGISGAFNGLGAIPVNWRKEVKNGAGLMDVAQRLCERS